MHSTDTFAHSSHASLNYKHLFLTLVNAESFRNLYTKKGKGQNGCLCEKYSHSDGCLYHCV